MAELLVLNAADRDAPRGHVFAVKPDGFTWGNGEHLTHEDCSFLVARVECSPAYAETLPGWVLDIDAAIGVNLLSLIAASGWSVPTVPLSAFAVPPEQAPTVEGA